MPLTIGHVPTLRLPKDARLGGAGHIDTVLVIHFDDFNPHLALLVRPFQTTAVAQIFGGTFFHHLGADRVLLSIFCHKVFQTIVAHVASSLLRALCH